MIFTEQQIKDHIYNSQEAVGLYRLATSSTFAACLL